MLKNYLLQNWSLILTLVAFAITLTITVFLDKKTIRRMYILIIAIFVLSIIVYSEFYVANMKEYRLLRTVFMAIRYSSTPIIVAQVIFTLVKKLRGFIFIPALALTIVDIISIFTGIVFKVDENNVFSRGPLGFLPFIVAGFYSIFLIIILLRRSNKRALEIVPIIFLFLALGSGLIFPFVFGSDFSQIFCTTMGIALFVYYVFSILQLTKTDSLTGLLNRQAYYADIDRNLDDITALVSIDMNGLKTINDTGGHAAGDDALVTLSIAFMRSLRRRQSCYRIGGDEFIIICRKNRKDEVEHLVKRLRNNIAETKYSCSIGYCYSEEKNKSMDELLKKSDEMMYQDKAQYYMKNGIDRRKT